MIRKIFRCRNMLYCTLALLAILFITRLIDFSILNSLVNSEHYHLLNNDDYQKENDDLYYLSIGFSFHNEAMKKLNAISKMDKKKIFIVNFFDLLSPARYLILNKEEKGRISLPWLGPGKERKIELVKGITEVNLYKFDYMSIKSKKKRKGTVIATIGSFLSDIIDLDLGDEKNLEKEKRAPFRLNFEEKTNYLKFSRYIKSIYLIYFYFPLILILILLQKFKIHLAFLYFITMSLLTGGYFIEFGPTLGLNELQYKSNIITTAIPLLIFVLYGIFFIKQILKGMIQWKKENLSINEKIIILYFLLLPIFLRF